MANLNQMNNKIIKHYIINKSYHYYYEQNCVPYICTTYFNDSCLI